MRCIKREKGNIIEKGDNVKYKKYNIGAYNLHVIQSNQFKTVQVNIHFKRKVEKKEITYRNVLKSILLESNAIYKTRRELDIKTEELYDLRYSIGNYISGNYNVLNLESVFLNEKFTEKGMLEKSLQFIIDILLHPNIQNEQFEEKSFQICKSTIKEQIESLQDNPKRYSTIRLLENIDKNSPLSYRGVGYLEDLNTINPNNLYEYYQTMLKKDLVDIFVIGDVDDQFIRKFLLEHFKINTVKKTGIGHFIEHSKARKIPKVIKEQLPIEQSQLLLGCKLMKLSDFELKYVLSIYSYILGGGPDSKLFKNVREKNSLCYSISSSSSIVNHLFFIRAGIQASDFKKTVSLIKKEMKRMEKGDFTQEEIDAAITTYIHAFQEIEDYQDQIIGTYISHEYLGIELPEERVEKIKQVTKNMVIDVAKKVHLDTIYLLEGASI